MLQQSAEEIVESVKEMPDGNFLEYLLKYPQAILAVNGSATYTKTKDFTVVSFPYEINFFGRKDYIYVSDVWKEDFFRYLEHSANSYDDIVHIEDEWYYIKWY